MLAKLPVFDLRFIFGFLFGDRGGIAADLPGRLALRLFQGKLFLKQFPCQGRQGGRDLERFFPRFRNSLGYASPSWTGNSARQERERPDMASEKKANPESGEAQAPTADEIKREAIRALTKANKDYPNATMGQQIKVAICRFILDEAGVSAPEERKAAMDAFMASPSWFGASANAMTESGVVAPTKRGEKVVGGFDA